MNDDWSNERLAEAYETQLERRTSSTGIAVRPRESAAVAIPTPSPQLDRRTRGQLMYQGELERYAEQLRYSIARLKMHNGVALVAEQLAGALQLDQRITEAIAAGATEAQVEIYRRAIDNFYVVTNRVIGVW